MKSILLFLFLLNSSHASDSFSCIFSVNKNGHFHSYHSSIHTRFHIWSWKNYWFFLEYHTGLSTRWSMNPPDDGARKTVNQVIVPDQKLFSMAIFEDGHLFHVSCTHIDDLPMDEGSRS